jgi:hypothetical protein
MIRWLPDNPETGRIWRIPLRIGEVQKKIKEVRGPLTMEVAVMDRMETGQRRICQMPHNISKITPPFLPPSRPFFPLSSYPTFLELFLCTWFNFSCHLGTLFDFLTFVDWSPPLKT